MSRIKFCGLVFCLLIIFSLVATQNVNRTFDKNQTSEVTEKITVFNSNSFDTTTLLNLTSILNNKSEINPNLELIDSQESTTSSIITKVETFNQDDYQKTNTNDSTDLKYVVEKLRELDKKNTSEQNNSYAKRGMEFGTIKDLIGNDKELSPESMESVKKLLESKGIKISDDSEVYKLSHRFIGDPDDLLKQWSRLTMPQTKVISLSERNSGDTVKQDKRDNYGVSAVLSGDIFALKSVVEKFEPSLCKNESLLLLQSLLVGKLWALKMYDSTAKSPTGLLYGNTFQLGNFDECLSVGTDDDSMIKGQYCLANVRLLKDTLPTTKYGQRFGPREDIHWAFCVPASCSSDLVESFVMELLLKSSGGGEVHIPPTNCHRRELLKVGKRDIIFISIIGAFTVFLLACTSFHIYLRYKSMNGYKRTKTVLIEAILSFSVARNLKKIFSVKKANDLGLDAISGIRMFSMFLILSGHALLFILSGPVTNTVFYDEMIKRVQNSIILANPLLVDSFLLISAFLFSRLLLLELDKRKGKVNVLPIYMFRYLRVTPSYIVVILLYMTWLDKLNEGPLWNSKMAAEKERCLDSWWTNILYINNYVHTDSLCMFQSWYLSVDTQLFFFAPALIYPLWRWPKFGHWFLGIVTSIFCFVPFIVTYWNRYDATILAFPKEMTDISKNFYFKEVYIKTHMRATAYCIGILCGYALHKIQSTGYKIKPNVQWMCWILSILFGASSVLSITLFFQPDYQYNPVTAALYSALHRVAWAAANGWLLIACCTKNFRPFDKMFKWKPLIVMGRLTYCAYLANGIVELHSYGTLRNSIYLSVFNLSIVCCSHILQTFVAALVLCVMFESPIHGFEKILLRTLVNSPKKNPAESKENLEESDPKS